MCIERFNIEDVARIHNLKIVRRSGQDILCVCPFCGDTRGKFALTVRKGSKSNLYNCFKCGAHGNAIDLHMELSRQEGGPDYSGPDGSKKAARDIFRAINGDMTFETAHFETEEAAKHVTESEKADDETVSRANYALLRCLKLEPEDKKDLLRRGLTEADIKRFNFKSMPKDPGAVESLLVKAGITLKGVPGHYKNKKGVWAMALPGNKDSGEWKPDTGYFCPAYDGERNLLLAFQTRPQHPKNGCKYLWFSSAGREAGVSSGAVATYLPGEHDNIVIITEGILKATVIYCLLKGQVTIIGVPGVKSIKSAEGYLERCNGSVVFEAYDMDKLTVSDDPDVQKKTAGIMEAAQKLQETVRDYGMPVHGLKWDVDETGHWKGNYKGLDDFLLGYGDPETFVKYLLYKAKKLTSMYTYLAS